MLMEIIDKLKDHDRWAEFLDYKLSREDMRKAEREDLQSFVENKEYESCVKRTLEGSSFSTPRLLEVNKNGIHKKRSVFTFERDENYVLKMITYLLREYDHLFSDNLYSFRNDTGVRKAVHRIIKSGTLAGSYAYKADIHDYFNSIDTGSILRMIETDLPEEKKLYDFFKRLLEDPYAVRNGEKIKIKKGVMAGTSTAGFLADLYLKDLDEYFDRKGIVYARYSDDIIVFSKDPESIRKYENVIKDHLRDKGLEINPLKEVRTSPGEGVEFLGFELRGKEINISEMAKKKIKGKLRRKARAIYRWKLRKNVESSKAARVFVRYMNNKFYHNALKGELTWCRWYFPLITTDDRLKIIDDYAVACIRYIYTGNHGKKNFDLRYRDIQALGFRSLVNNFWKYKEGRYEAE